MTIATEPVADRHDDVEATQPLAEFCDVEKCVVPVAGTPVHQQVTVVVPAHADVPDHYYPACCAAFWCGCCGVIGMLMCCRTNRGKAGASMGCIGSQICGLIMIPVLLLILDSLNVDKSFTARSRDECTSEAGFWLGDADDAGTCMCPPFYITSNERDEYGNKFPTCTFSKLVVFFDVAFSVLILVASCALWVIYTRRAKEAARTVTVNVAPMVV